jgi:type IV pilus assembly protein PilM
LSRWFKSKHRSILGVDISPTSVRIVEISCQGDKPHIESYGYESLPPNVIEANGIIDINALAFSIKKLCAQINPASKSVVLAVPDSTVTSKIIQLAEGLDETELEELVFIEADNYLSYPAEQSNIDFTILGPSSKHPGMLDVFFVASRAENVNRRVEAITRAGLETKIVGIESDAIARVVSNIPGQNKIIAVIDINFLVIHFFIVDSGRSVFTGEESLNLGHPYVEMIILQIKRFLQFFFSTSHYDFVEHIFLAGELARLTALASLIEKEIGIPTSVANPFQHFIISKNLHLARLTNLAPSFFVACGLALRGVNHVCN